MRKVENLNEISDGRIYELNGMVRAGCQDCQGCSDCCRGMGNSILLDPLDIFRMTLNGEHTFEELLVSAVELNVVDGIILPNLKMVGESEQCYFLNQEGRCNIHSYRPGICRLFPLGRCYEEHSFRYFLQTNECSKQNRTKVKVSKWIDTPDIKQNQQYIIDWHYFLKGMEEMLMKQTDDAVQKQVNMYLLNAFYVTPYDKAHDFYSQFYKRLESAKAVFSQFMD
ncbi:MAG TPA: YkgJ family cysteine cluster protein [Lachnospiraceae bacterium]|mgnify:CR=1 FL=1|nr:YkgJ family cysteine cluster protein [uncultured Lachnoclostridium sp.]HAU85048.1 YkgJ family cysteine cluster protein [Lachnospiraceae bacterium]